MGGDRAVSFAVSLADPIGLSPVVAAVQWLEHTLLGTVATTVAIIAVAWVGFMTLSGRANIRRGVTVILGCFVLFGATRIVAGIRSTIDRGGPAEVARVTSSRAPAPALIIPSYPARNPDPYAGASVPTR